MTDQDPQNEPAERGVIDLVRGIKTGAIGPKSISTDERRRCAEHLRGEGLSTAEIAKVLGVADRTIRRDHEANADARAIQPDAAMADRYAGHLMHEADLAITRIRRITREDDATPAARIEAARACFDIQDKVCERLQSMGYLPKAAQHLEASVTHNAGDLSSLASLSSEIERLQTIEAEARPSDEGRAQAALGPGSDGGEQSGGGAPC